MKRNNIFMWAYISFIFISGIVRIISDFPLWSSIVLAITISSFIFAFEDFYSTISNMYKDLYNISKNFISETKNKIAEDLVFLHSVRSKTELYKKSKYDIFDIEKSFETLEEKCNCAEKKLKKIETDMNNNFGMYKKYKKLAFICSFMGFLLLFCTLVFTSFVTVPTLLQEIITVFSFAIILSTQQFKVLAYKRIERNTVNSEDAVKAYEKASKALTEVCQRVDYLFSLIEESEKENGGQQ